MDVRHATPLLQVHRRLPVLTLIGRNCGFGKRNISVWETLYNPFQCANCWFRQNNWLLWQCNVYLTLCLSLLICQIVLVRLVWVSGAPSSGSSQSKWILITQTWDIGLVPMYYHHGKKRCSRRCIIVPLSNPLRRLLDQPWLVSRICKGGICQFTRRMEWFRCQLKSHCFVSWRLLWFSVYLWFLFHTCELWQFLSGYFIARLIKVDVLYVLLIQ